MAKVIIKPIDNVSFPIFRQLYRLSYSRNGGRMKDNLERVLNYKKNCNNPIGVANVKVFYILNNQEVISWGMVYNQQYIRNDRLRTSKRRSIDIYTNPRHRNKGYGSAIVKAMVKEYQSHKLYGYEGCTSIYEKHGIKED